MADTQRIEAMDPALYEMLEGDPEDEVAAVIRFTDAEAVPPGVRLVTRFGDVATCRLKRSDILETRGADDVLSLKAPRLVAPPEPDPEVDEVELGEELQARDERRPPSLTETGRGVVVGGIDWGLDVAHPEMRRPDGSTRLLALWDQRGGPRRESPTRYGYGVVHDAAAIDRALRTPDPYSALGYHPADSEVGEQGSHGQHVMSIAAGNGRSRGPSGIAPEADLVFVHMVTIGTPAPTNLGDSVSLLEAVDFIFATAGDRPCVINMSLGRHWGSHDGTSLVEQGLDAALLAAPGRAICQSGGNYFHRRIHASGQLRPGETRTLAWEADEADVTPNELEVWYSHRDRFLIDIEAPDGTRSKRVALGERDEVSIAGRVACRIYHRAHDPNNLDHHINAFVYPHAPDGTWTVRITGEDVVDGRYHAWIERDAACRGCQSTFHARDADPTTTTGTICNGFRTIAVGAYNGHSPSRTLAPFSSSGPTRDGRVKPDLVAPGEAVLAARSARRGEEVPLLTRKSGTSMAAPHVTGTVACMFEAAGRPLPIETTRRLLLASTDREGRTAENADRIGSGYLDVERAVEAARQFARPAAAASADTTDEVPHQIQRVASASRVSNGGDVMTFPETDEVPGTSSLRVHSEVEQAITDADRASRNNGPDTPVNAVADGAADDLDEGLDDEEILAAEARELGGDAVFDDDEGEALFPPEWVEQDPRLDSPPRLLGQIALGGITVVISAPASPASPASPAAPVTATLDDALRHAITLRGVHTAIIGDMLAGRSFDVLHWEPSTVGSGGRDCAMLPAMLPDVAEVTASLGVALCAVLFNGGETVYVPADPAGGRRRWVRIPRLTEFYNLPAADQAAHRDRWIGRLRGISTGFTRPQLASLSMPALRLLLARHAAVAVPVHTVRRGHPPTDRGGRTDGVTLPVLRLPIAEPDCYLPVIAEVEGKLESVNAWDWDAGISIGPIQFNVKRAALFRFLSALLERDRALFDQELGAPLGWSLRAHEGHIDLVIDSGQPSEVSLHGRAGAPDEDRNARYFQSGTPGGMGYNPAFRRTVAERFRNLLVWPHVQEIVIETSAWWLREGLNRLPGGGIPPLDTRNPERDTFVLRALLLSTYVRFSGCLTPLMRRLQPWPTAREKLANWADALAGTPVPCPTLHARLTQQQGHAANVHAQIRRLTGAPAGEEERSESFDVADAPPSGLRDEAESEEDEVTEEAFSDPREWMAASEDDAHVPAESYAHVGLEAESAVGEWSSDAWAADEQAEWGERDLAASEVDSPAVVDSGEALVALADTLVATRAMVSARPLMELLLRRTPEASEEAAAANFAVRLQTPGALFEACVGQGAGDLRQHLDGMIEVIGLPGQRLTDGLRAGDLIVRRVPGESDPGHLAVLAGPGLWRHDELVEAGLRAEPRGPGYYGSVVEGGPFPHRLADAATRQVLDASGRVPQNQMIVRPAPVMFDGVAGLTEEVNRRTPEYARWIQSSLNQVANAGLAVDGIVGPRTRAATVAFQRQKGLVADGIVGPITERALIEAGAPHPPGAVVPPPVPVPPLPPLPAGNPTVALGTFAAGEAFADLIEQAGPAVQTEIVLLVGATGGARATGSPTPVGRPAYTWTVSDSRVVRVDVPGNDAQTHPNRVAIVGLRPGRATVTATYRDSRGRTATGSLTYVVASVAFSGLRDPVGRPVAPPGLNDLTRPATMADRRTQPAHRTVEARLEPAAFWAGKSVRWTFTPSGRVRGALPAAHPSNLEAAAGFTFDSTTATTTITATGTAAVRVNLPPTSFNRGRLTVTSVDHASVTAAIDLEVPGIVVVDPGHGGNVNLPGASANNATSVSGVLEKDMTLDFGRRVRGALQGNRDHTIRVFMTRDADVNASGADRARTARDNGADVFLSIHFNGDGNAAVRGTETFVRANTNANVNRAEDAALARRVQDAVVGAIPGGRERPPGVKDDTQTNPGSLAVLSDVSLGNTAAFHPIRSCLVEIEFITNRAVDDLFNTVANRDAARQNVADAIARAIVDDLTNQP